jgi:dienelactone hydrolase
MFRRDQALCAPVAHRVERCAGVVLRGERGVVVRRLTCSFVALVVFAALTVCAVNGVGSAGAVASSRLSVGDVTIVEGNSGRHVAKVPVTLAAPSLVTETVSYTANSGSAVSGVDYVARTGTITFLPGAVSKTIAVTVLGDITAEPDATIDIEITSSTATITKDSGTITILDDDQTPLVGASIGDVSISEGDAKQRTAIVPITLSAPVMNMNVHVQVSRTGATAASRIDDKAAASRTVTFPAGVTAASVSVAIVPDTLLEDDETVQLILSSIEVTVGRDAGTLTILDDASDVGAALSSPGSTPAVYQPPAVVPAGAPGEVIWAQPIAGPTGADTYLILFRSIGQRGKASAQTAVLSIPTAAAPPTGRNVVVWAAPTTASADTCAPSKLLAGLPIPVEQQLIDAGNVVVAPDFEGLGTPGPHAYLESDSEAHSVLDAARAARDFDASISNRVVAYGWSRGGHAAIAADERAPAYAPDLNFKGAVGIAAGTINMDDSVMDNLISQGSWYPGLMLAVMRAYQGIYGATTAGSLLNYYLTPTGKSVLPSVDTDCQFGYSTWSSHPASTLFHLTPRPAPSASVAALRSKIAIGLQHANSPIILLHGTADPLIPLANVNTWIDGACAQGDQITLHTYLGAVHNPMPAPNNDIFNVLTGALNDTPDGLPITRSCP